ncbi:uncharacterized protein LOC143581254 [Bidens hawaiensis]|uniref:uncharacterized protein LOC143581254 n=1 Tax=Bidens hawaiensis TaxID=980011 RepID=UPI00404A8607
MKRSRQDLLRQKFNMFNHVLGETLESQLQRFISLVTEMRTAGILLQTSEINNKLVNSLPKNWDMHVAVIKKTKDLIRMSMTEMIATIKACDMDDKQRAINHASSYSAAGYNVTSNSALMSQDSFSLFKPSQPPPLGNFQMFSSTLGQSSSSNSPNPAAVFFTKSGQSVSDARKVASSVKPSQIPTIPKETQENIALMAGFMNCYHAFLAGDLVQPMAATEFDQIHPDDVEEMDISWQIAMVVFRAKKFTKRTGRNNWNMPNNQKVGFNKETLRCCNCHEPGHFARECTNPAKEGNMERALVPAENARGEAGGSSSNGERGMVAQTFS